MTAARGDPTAPAGVGLAVVFFWALAAQLTTQGLAAPLDRLGVSGGAGGALSRFAGALLVLGFGELLRGGVSWTRIPAAVLLLALTAGGLVNAVRLLAGHGTAGLVLSTVVMLTWAPWIAARLLSRRTAVWFAAAASRRGATHFAGHWLWALAAWSVVWGVLVAWSQSL